MPIEGNIACIEANYYILVKAKDAFGGPFGYYQRYPVNIHIHHKITPRRVETDYSPSGLVPA